jgi:hypothetical protein
VHDLLRSSNRCGYPDGNVHLLLDHQATAEEIRYGLDWLANSASSGDTALIFFSGHGGRVQSGPEAGNYLIPYDCDPTDLRGSAISGEDLTAFLLNIRAQRLLVVFDSCYAGGTGEIKGLAHEGAAFKSGLEEDYYAHLANGAGRVIMASSRSDEVSLVLDGMSNSLFTHYFLEALQGKAHTRGDGLIRIFDIFHYVSEKVPAQGPQHPIFKAGGVETNFPIALYLGGKRITPNINKVLLLEVIIKYFTMEDLEVLCAYIERALAEDGIELMVNLGMVGGTGKPAKVLNLITYLDNQRYLAYLVEAVHLKRPGVI